jgi:hypothetical protein
MDLINLRTETLNMKAQRFLMEPTRLRWPLVEAFNQKKGGLPDILAWDQVIDYMNGGISERGKAYHFKIGPSQAVVERDFRIYFEMYLSTNNTDTDRMCVKLHIQKPNDWELSKEFYWQPDTDVAVAYYGIQILIYDLCEAALEKGRHTLKYSEKLEKQLMEILKSSYLE